MESKNKDEHVYPYECRSMHVGVNNYSACGIKGLANLDNAQKDAKDLETIFKQDLKFHEVMRISDQNFGAKAYDKVYFLICNLYKFLENLQTWTTELKGIAKRGIMYNGETLGLFPHKQPNGTVELQFINIEQIARNLALIKNLFSLIFFDGCRKIYKDENLNIFAEKDPEADPSKEEKKQSKNITNLKEASKQLIHERFEGVSVIVYTVYKGLKVNEANEKHGTPQFIQYIQQQVIGNKQYGWEFIDYFAQFQVNSLKPMRYWKNVQIFQAKTEFKIQRQMTQQSLDEKNQEEVTSSQVQSQQNTQNIGRIKTNGENQVIQKVQANKQIQKQIEKEKKENIQVVQRQLPQQQNEIKFPAIKLNQQDQEEEKKQRHPPQQNVGRIKDNQVIQKVQAKKKIQQPKQEEEKKQNIQKVQRPLPQQQNVIDSKLIKQDDYQLLKEYLNTNNLTLQLIYRGTDHGFAIKTFHLMCDNQGPTLTVALSEHYQLFGGYASIPWESPNQYQYKQDSQAFLFQLTKKFKLTQYQNQDKAVFHSSQFGPIFGGGIFILSALLGLFSSINAFTGLGQPGGLEDELQDELQGGHDLVIGYYSKDFDQDGSCFSNIHDIKNSSYSLPLEIQNNEEEAKKYLAGSQSFKLKEIEVFKVIIK